jgi:hypothetical protein
LDRWIFSGLGTSVWRRATIAFSGTGTLVRVSGIEEKSIKMLAIHVEASMQFADDDCS